MADKDHSRLRASLLFVALSGLCCVAVAAPITFDIEVLSRATAYDEYVQYDYLVFAVDYGPNRRYRELSAVNNVFPDGAEAYDSVDWESLQVWTNVSSADDWLAELEHGYIGGPYPGGQYWGDKWSSPDGAGNLIPNGDGISFVDPSSYAWEGYGDALLNSAADSGDGFIAFSFRSTAAPTMGEWWAKGGSSSDYGTAWVPGSELLLPANPAYAVVPEASSLLLLPPVLAGLAGIAEGKRRRRR